MTRALITFHNALRDKSILKPSGRKDKKKGFGNEFGGKTVGAILVMGQRVLRVVIWYWSEAFDKGIIV